MIRLHADLNVTLLMELVFIHLNIKMPHYTQPHKHKHHTHKVPKVLQHEHIDIH